MDLAKSTQHVRLLHQLQTPCMSARLGYILYLLGWSSLGIAAAHARARSVLSESHDRNFPSNFGAGLLRFIYANRPHFQIENLNLYAAALDHADANRSFVKAY